MSFWRVLLCIFFPPLAVLDKGCGSILIVFILWCLGWIPGTIAALIIVNNPNR
ncbi:YqaE/Pmp3 family membrane protein [Mesoflavibacter zeaxanthinifaciens]|uniref:YqaE/Pmp3 family membrane protein n=1 Tax=Mesoflavibacter zeaxanthinifaciens TaxID=393060 RepID=UPI0026EFFE4C|nr:YqaE/Pmp3 family membrane protein [Mesoflavibacter zeaxanthinifaciens]